MTREELIKKIDAEIAKLYDNADLHIEDEGYRVACKDISDVLHKIAKEIQPTLPSNLDEAARKYGHEKPILPEEYNDGDIPLYEGWTAEAFKAGAEWQREQYECIPTEEAYMRGFAQGAKEEREAFTPLINRLCEAILFEWKDAADLARKTLIQIKED